MLALTRRVGQVINIGDDIEVIVLGINGRQVRLGIRAPIDVPVHRQEIYERILAERQEANGSAHLPPTQSPYDDSRIMNHNKPVKVTYKPKSRFSRDE